MMKDRHHMTIFRLLAVVTSIASLLILVLILDNKQGEIVVQENDEAIAALPRPEHTISKLQVQAGTPKMINYAEIQRKVDELNKDNVERLEAFEEDGWEVVTIDDPPDEKLMNLDLSLLNDREEELQFQIQSNSYADSDLERLISVAVATGNEKTRYVALEALGRSASKHAGELLIEAYGQMDDPDTRSQILGYLLPTSPTDNVSVFLANQLGEPDAPDSVKRQASYPLAIMALLDGQGTVAEEIAALVPEPWREGFEDVVEELRTGGRTKAGQNGRWRK